MHELSLFASAFFFVCALVVQQRNVQLRCYLSAMLNAGFIASLNLFVIRLGGQATETELLAYIAGQALGTLAAMHVSDWWIDRRRAANCGDSDFKKEGC